jgi:hypothetical protein
MNVPGWLAGMCVLMTVAFLSGKSLEAKQYAIIKADDFIVQPDAPSKAVSEAFLNFIELVKAKKVVAGLGSLAPC